MKSKSRKNTGVILGVLYILLSLFAVVGEYQRNVTLLRITMPFLIPLIALFYLLSSKKVNTMYLLALTFAWVANFFFTLETQDFIFNGTVSYSIFWIFITFLILKNNKFPNKISFSIAFIPFSFIYCCVFQLICDNIDNNIYLFLVNGFFMIFLGAFSLANYFSDSNKSNTFLLISILSFTFIQFLVSLELYYVSTKIFRPIALVLFVSAQYFLLKTFLSYEYVGSKCHSLNPFDVSLVNKLKKK